MHPHCGTTHKCFPCYSLFNFFTLYWYPTYKAFVNTTTKTNDTIYANKFLIICAWLLNTSHDPVTSMIIIIIFLSSHYFWWISFQFFITPAILSFKALLTHLPQSSKHFIVCITPNKPQSCCIELSYNKHCSWNIIATDLSIRFSKILTGYLS